MKCEPLKIVLTSSITSRDTSRSSKITRKTVLRKPKEPGNPEAKMSSKNKEKIRNFWGKSRKLIQVWAMKKNGPARFKIHGGKSKIDSSISALSIFYFYSAISSKKIHLLKSNTSSLWNSSNLVLNFWVKTKYKTCAHKKYSWCISTPQILTIWNWPSPKSKNQNKKYVSTKPLKSSLDNPNQTNPTAGQSQL